MGEQSPAYKLMQAAVRASELTAWIDINRSRRALLFWMIEARIPFESDDIGVINTRFNGGHWFPVESDDLLTTACKYKNKSAIAAVSGYLGRPVLDGDTVCCACSKADAAAGRCHRVWAAHALARQGWRVILDGEELVVDGG